MQYPMIAFNKLHQPPVGADYAHERNNPDICRGRLIAPTADESALVECPGVHISYSICIIVP